ncbi:unnamed protein product [Caenorhabditis brenneri]
MKVWKVVRNWYLRRFLRIPKLSAYAKKTLSKDILDRDTYVIANIASTSCFISWYVSAYLCLVFEKITVILHFFFALLSLVSLVMLLFFFAVLTQRTRKLIRYNMYFPMHRPSILVSVIGLASVEAFTWLIYPDSIGVNAWKWFPAFPIVLKSCFFVSHFLATLMIRDAYLAYSATYMIIYNGALPTSCIVNINGIWTEFSDPRWGLVLEEEEKERKRRARLARKTRHGVRILLNSSTMTSST